MRWEDEFVTGNEEMWRPRWEIKNNIMHEMER